MHFNHVEHVVTHAPKKIQIILGRATTTKRRERASEQAGERTE